jgi:predicted transcriptional regulator
VKTMVVESKKIKHSVYLDPTISRRLKRMKGETDESLSEIIEEALARHLRTREGVSRRQEPAEVST